MKLEVNEIENILHCKQGEYLCHACNEETPHLYYCEQERKVYCLRCIINNRACKNRVDHTDLIIHGVVYDE